MIDLTKPGSIWKPSQQASQLAWINPSENSSTTSQTFGRRNKVRVNLDHVCVCVSPAYEMKKEENVCCFEFCYSRILL